MGRIRGCGEAIDAIVLFLLSIKLYQYTHQRVHLREIFTSA